MASFDPSRRRLALLLPFAAIAAACGGGNGASETITSVPTPSPTPAPSPSPSPAPSPSPSPAPAATGYFTDVTSAPVGGYVTVYQWDGQNVARLKQVQFTGAAIDAGGQTFTIAQHSGRVREATPSTLASIIQSVQPGDQIVCRAGTYTGKFDGNGWNESQFVLNAAQSGTAAQPISITAYPGETVVFNNTSGRPNFYMGRQDASQRCNYWTISNLTLSADAMNFDGGGVTSGTGQPESGGTNIRVIGNILQMRALGNVAAGQIELQGDGWVIMGNDFQNDYARQIVNLNHAIYVDCGADNTEIAYNRFVDRREGFLMMVHQDGTPMNYTGTWFHHNYVKARQTGDVRGVSQSNADDASTMLVEDNYFENVGQGGFGIINAYRGVVRAHRNQAVNCIGDAMLATDNLFGGSRTLYYGTGSNANMVVGSLAMSSGSNILAEA